MMAVQGAHLTSTSVEEDASPSIFEVLAQESLVHSLRPALQHLLRIFAENNPGRYGKLYAYNEEVYMILQLILENYSLRQHNASFSENFYGMKRVLNSKSCYENPEDQADASENTDHGQLIQTAPGSRLLPPYNRAMSMLFLVFIPYLKHKCELWYERLKKETYHSHQQTSETQQHNIQKWKKKLCQAFLGIYPIVHFAWESTMLTFHMAYIFKKSRVHTPFLRWAGVLLKNLDEEDIEASNVTQPLDLHNKGWSEGMLLLANKGLNGLAVSLSTGLSVGVFFLQFLEWWYASDQHAVTLTALPVPPPPEPLPDAAVPKLHTLCPSCQRVRTNDTALAVSGYVFCYTCIAQYVTKNSCCPVTQFPATQDHLVRLYLPDG